MFSQTTDMEVGGKKIMKTFMVGVNGSYLFKNIFENKALDSIGNPHNLILRYSFNKIGIRAGIGGFSKSSIATSEGFADNITVNNFQLNLRLGVDYTFTLNDKFNFNFGLDILKQSTLYRSTEDSGFDVLEKTSQSDFYGTGPIMGISYQIAKNFTLYTEAAFYFLSGSSQNGVIYKNFPELNDVKLNVDIKEIKNYLPASIYLTYTF